jgi:hypothetical protein
VCRSARRHESDDQARQQRDREREREHPRVRGKVRREGDLGRNRHPLERARPQVGQRKATRSAEREENQNFRQQLPDESQARCTERGAHRHLASPGEGLRREHRSDVDAGDDEHERRRAEQDAQECLKRSARVWRQTDQRRQAHVGVLVQPRRLSAFLRERRTERRELAMRTNCRASTAPERGWSTSAFMTLKIVVTAPAPSEMQRTATTAKSGL